MINMAIHIRMLLGDLRRGLEGLYGGRLRGLYLFGSFARGESDADSDVDVLIVLEEVSRYGEEVARTSELIGGLALRHGQSISRIFISENDWLLAKSGFLANVRSEAVAA
jgi:predicted nucleotidyltransferase